MLAGYRRKRVLMMDLLNRSEFFRCPTTQGAFYTFPTYNFPIKSLDLAKELLEEVHVATLPGSAFGECGENHLRLSYATSDEDIVEALDRIENYIGSKI
jgi:aminotransferase